MFKVTLFNEFKFRTPTTFVKAKCLEIEIKHLSDYNYAALYTHAFYDLEAEILVPVINCKVYFYLNKRPQDFSLVNIWHTVVNRVDIVDCQGAKEDLLKDGYHQFAYKSFMLTVEPYEWAQASSIYWPFSHRLFKNSIKYRKPKFIYQPQFVHNATIKAYFEADKYGKDEIQKGGPNNFIRQVFNIENDAKEMFYGLWDMQSTWSDEANKDCSDFEFHDINVQFFIMFKSY